MPWNFIPVAPVPWSFKRNSCEGHDDWLKTFFWAKLIRYRFIYYSIEVVFLLPRLERHLISNVAISRKLTTLSSQADKTGRRWQIAKQFAWQEPAKQSAWEPSGWSHATSQASLDRAHSNRVSCFSGLFYNFFTTSGNADDQLRETDTFCLSSRQGWWWWWWWWAKSSIRLFGFVQRQSPLYSLQ